MKTIKLMKNGIGINCVDNEIIKCDTLFNIDSIKFKCNVLSDFIKLLNEIKIKTT